MILLLYQEYNTLIRSHYIGRSPIYSSQVLEVHCWEQELCGQIGYSTHWNITSEKNITIRKGSSLLLLKVEGIMLNKMSQKEEDKYQLCGL